MEPQPLLPPPSSRIPAPSRIRPPQSFSVKRPSSEKENLITTDSKKSRMDVPVAAIQKPITQMKRAQSVLSLNSLANHPVPTAGKKLAVGGGRFTNISSGKQDSNLYRKAVSSNKTKRPPWDLKGRIQDMEDEFGRTASCNKELREQLELTNERIALLEEINSRLHNDVECKTSQSEEASKALQHLETMLSEKEKELTTNVNRLKMETEELRSQKSNLELQLINLKGELTVSHGECQSLKCTVAQLTASQIGLNAQLETTKSLLQAEKMRKDEALTEIEKLNKIIQERDDKIANLDAKIRQDETIRRKMHNSIQELKGNIRVYCRVRPLLPAEEYTGMEHIVFPDPEHRIIELTRSNDVSLNESAAYGKSKLGTKFKFTYDRVFDSTSSQEEVFEEISQLIQSALDGYNVCIFAYGQTGSGKTYTMEGPEDIIDFRINSENPLLGIIPRTICQVFDSISMLEKKGWKYQAEASFLEIYNESIRDLLSDLTSSRCEIKMSGSKSKDAHVTNVTMLAVSSQEEVLVLLKKARKNRAVAATLCNEHSSRSHSIFRLKLNGHNEITSEKCEGTLNLVDLAGSERLKESGSEGDRLVETKNINRSLSNLGNVIMALAQKAEHIPYRNSKLTHLLMNSLGGNSKTLMFVNVSPSEDHINETINSLRFATKVNQCQIGTAHKQVK